MVKNLVETASLSSFVFPLLFSAPSVARPSVDRLSVRPSVRRVRSFIFKGRIAISAAVFTCGYAGIVIVSSLILSYQRVSRGQKKALWSLFQGL